MEHCWGRRGQVLALAILGGALASCGGGGGGGSASSGAGATQTLVVPLVNNANPSASNSLAEFGVSAQGVTREGTLALPNGSAFAFVPTDGDQYLYLVQAPAVAGPPPYSPPLEYQSYLVGTGSVSPGTSATFTNDVPYFSVQTETPQGQTGPLYLYGGSPMVTQTVTPYSINVATGALTPGSTVNLGSEKFFGFAKAGAVGTVAPNVGNYLVVSGYDASTGIPEAQLYQIQSNGNLQAVGSLQSFSNTAALTNQPYMLPGWSDVFFETTPTTGGFSVYGASLTTAGLGTPQLDTVVPNSTIAGVAQQGTSEYLFTDAWDGSNCNFYGYLGGANGSITPVANGASLSGALPSGALCTLTTGPGPYLYIGAVGANGEATVYGFQINAGGGWTATGSVSTATPAGPFAAPVVDSLNDRVLLASATSLYAWSINMTTGSLSPLWGPQGSPDAGDSFGSIWLAPSS